MEIFSLSGPSGTGKSTSALTFAHKHKIPAIIDDGLLIINGEKVAGTSAKYEKNSLTAVKRATFFENDQFIAKKGEGIHHIALRVDNVEEYFNHLKTQEK